MKALIASLVLFAGSLASANDVVIIDEPEVEVVESVESFAIGQPVLFAAAPVVTFAAFNPVVVESDVCVKRAVVRERIRERVIVRQPVVRERVVVRERRAPVVRQRSRSVVRSRGGGVFGFGFGF